MIRLLPICFATVRLWQPSSQGKEKSLFPQHPGKLHCIVGPMFSMKTTFMLQKISQYADVTHTRALVINHEMDRGRKTGNNVDHVGLSSHSSQFCGISPMIDTCYARKLADVDVSNYLIIGIDEMCFFDDLEETLKLWISQGKHIYCAGLDGNFRAEPFEQVVRLVSISDSFQKVTAVCQTCTDNNRSISPDVFVSAPFTSKIDGDLQSSAVEAGGKDKYRPSCRFHHQQLLSQSFTK